MELSLKLNKIEHFEKAQINYRFYNSKMHFSEVLKIASKLKKRVVIGTTGFTQKEKKI